MFTVPPALRPYSALAVPEVMRNSCTASFTWNGTAWLLLLATLSTPSSKKLLVAGRFPATLNEAPAKGDPCSTS